MKEDSRTNIQDTGCDNRLVKLYFYSTIFISIDKDDHDFIRKIEKFTNIILRYTSIIISYVITNYDYISISSSNNARYNGQSMI